MSPGAVSRRRDRRGPCVTTPTSGAGRISPPCSSRDSDAETLPDRDLAARRDVDDRHVPHEAEAVFGGRHVGQLAAAVPRFAKAARPPDLGGGGGGGPPRPSP